MGDGFDTGSFSSSYQTTFLNSSTDPEDAIIEYTGGDSISCPECFLLVKDGASAPNWYVFNISSWNGTETIYMEDFWVGQGAISHVTIFGNNTSVPEPGTLALLACGLLGLSLKKHMKKTS